MTSQQVQFIALCQMACGLTGIISMVVLVEIREELRKLNLKK